MNAQVEQLSVNLAVEVQKRDALEAEIRQTLTETRFEIRQLQQSRAKAIDAIKAVKEHCQQLQVQYVENEASIAGLRRDVDRLLDDVLAQSRVSAPPIPESVSCHQHDHLQEGQPTPPEIKRTCSTNQHRLTRAESMVSDLDDARSDVSSSVTVTTGYAHSSLDAALAAIRAMRGQ